jgi:hypothetical protein
MSKIIDFGFEHSRKKLENISEEAYSNALLSLGLAAFSIMHRDTKKRALLKEQAEAVFIALNEGDTSIQDLHNVIDGLVR